MDVLIILIFASLVLVGGGLVLLFSRISGGDFEHGDRLSLLPLEPERHEPKDPGTARLPDREGESRPS